MQLTNLSKHSSLKAVAIRKSRLGAFFSHLEMLLTQFKSRRQMRFGSTPAHPPTRRSIFSLFSPSHSLACFLYFCVRWNWSGDDVERTWLRASRKQEPFPLFLPVWNTRSPEHTHHELSLTAAIYRECVTVISAWRWHKGIETLDANLVSASGTHVPNRARAHPPTHTTRSRLSSFQNNAPSIRPRALAPALGFNILDAAAGFKRARPRIRTFLIYFLKERFGCGQTS